MCSLPRSRSWCSVKRKVVLTSLSTTSWYAGGGSNPPVPVRPLVSPSPLVPKPGEGPLSIGSYPYPSPGLSFVRSATASLISFFASRSAFRITSGSGKPMQRSVVMCCSSSVSIFGVSPSRRLIVTGCSAQPCSCARRHVYSRLLLACHDLASPTTAPTQVLWRLLSAEKLHAPRGSARDENS